MQAIDISNKNRLSQWDSLIVAAVQKANCNILYSEDLNPDLTIDSVTI
jgi:predicted nucleic acid-binding protein